MKNRNRRKFLNELSDRPTVSIAVSELTGNFLVLYGNKIFDSSCKRTDAEKVAAWLRKETSINPLPKNWYCDLDSLARWIADRPTSPPITEAVAIDLFTGTKRVING